MTDNKAKKGYLKPNEIEKFRALLWEKRNELLGNVSYLEKDIKKDESSELSHIPLHMADLGTDSYEQDFAIDLMDSERKIILEIDKALQRIEKGEYGICEIGGEEIPKARLEAIPWAKCCVKCASSSEKKSNSRNDSSNKYSFNSIEDDDDSDEDDVKKVS
ncbi:MAG: TraR/DksA family transcriptional regulator [Sedimentisphaerales bacterium]|nr:TraR/DksA family transcriptional regulator [Sedimentisphaerales bacterium]